MQCLTPRIQRLRKFSTPHAKAEAFNSFFYSTFTPDDGRCSPVDTFDSFTNQPILAEIHLSVEEVAKALASLDPYKARGPDKIPTIVLKQCAEALASSLSLLFNRSLALSRIPSEWKKSLVVPVHKKLRKDNVENYRPISLLCITSKVLERCVFQHTIEHFAQYFSNCQHGFRQERSTVTQLLEFLHKIGYALDRGQQSDIIYLDFAKAFDSVSHSRLVLKLHHYGIRGSLLQWYTDYLSNRKQCTVLQGVTSAPLSVISGVPQGSILGPLLFLVYINDLLSVVDNETIISLFADISKCHRTISSVADCNGLQDDLDTMVEWSKAWRLRFNADKCEVLSGTRTRSPQV